MGKNGDDNGQGMFDFDRTEGERRKEEGLARAGASLSRQQLLELGKLAAHRVGRRQDGVTSDDVCVEMRREGLDYAELGPAAGSIFRGKEWVFTKTWKKSERVTNHASDLRVWRLRQDVAVGLPPKKEAQSAGHGNRDAA